MKLFRVVLCILSAAGAGSCFAADPPAPNRLSPAETDSGCKLLFDGTSLKGWHTFGKSTLPAKGWEAVDGWLHCARRANAGDIVTEQKFDQFELSWEWKIAAGGNSGLKYFVTSDRASALGHEYQMYDDPGSKDQPPGKHETASFYDVLAPSVKPPVRPPGEINASRVVIKDNHVEHWLNGVKVLEYECASDKVKAAVAASKFKSTPGFGSRLKGHILLQDHGSEVWFRNIKVRELR